VRDCVEGFTGVQTDHIHSSSLVHQCSHSIIESHKVGQAGLALGEAMLTVSFTSLSSMCLSIASRRICSMIFPGTEMRLTVR